MTTKSTSGPDRGLPRIELLGFTLVALAITFLVVESSIEAYAGPSSFKEAVLRWPPNLLIPAGVGVLSGLGSASGQITSPWSRVVVAMVTLCCGIVAVGTLAIAYGYAFMMRDFN